MTVLFIVDVFSPRLRAHSNFRPENSISTESEFLLDEESAFRFSKAPGYRFPNGTMCTEGGSRDVMGWGSMDT